MASADSEVADSPDVASFGPSTPAGGSNIAGSGGGVGAGAGTKRGLGDNEVDLYQASATANAAAEPNKKKKTGTSSRGVANLTPEQLAKKRANDREAQRAIRERTRNQIDALERRIEQLTNLKPYEELQVAIRAKEAVERENVDIKRRLASIMTMLQSIVGSTATDAVPQNHPCIQHANVAQSSESISTPPSAAHSSHLPLTASPGWGGSQTTSPGGPSDPAMPQQLQNQRHQLRQGLRMGGEKLGLDFLLRPGQLVNKVRAASHGAQDTPQYRHVPMKHDGVAINSSREPWTYPLATRLSECSGYDAPQQASSPHYQRQESSPLYPQQQQQDQQDQQQQQQQQQHQDSNQGHHSAQNSLPYYALPVKNSESSCPLDTILLNFLSERRQHIAEGLPMHEVIGPRYPSVSSLLNSANSIYSHPLSKIFTDVLARFPDISRLPERIAVLYVMFLVMRWQISPTRENYERLPSWMTPQPSQIECPHPAWVDYVPFPVMRERLARIWISKPGEYDLEQFFIPYTTTLSVSWPYEDTDALLILPDSDDVIINPVFERHMRNGDNWKLGASFARAFPELVDTFGLDPGQA
ncbi:hypothetical protein E4U30_004795 [Claviceps sp. LM220 group G6]|nr:hypothetical protein E4U30_004795 [Claviceps sp. LM220 group G6]